MQAPTLMSDISRLSITRDKLYEEVWAQESGGNWPAKPKQREEGSHPERCEGWRARQDSNLRPPA